jgi:hypothetical protein
MDISSEYIDVVNLIHNNNRADALDKINDLLYAKASEVIDTYKKTVASSYFDEPVGETEDQ